MSPKNKGKFGKAKPAVEMEDQFVSGASRAAEALKPHIWRIAVAVTVITLMVVVYSLYSWWNQSKETAATSVYAEALELAQRDIVPAGETMPDEADADGRTFTSSEERATAVLAVLDRLRSEYGGTDVAAEARLLEARMLLDAGRFDEAAKAYDTYASRGSSPELRAVAREGIGYVYEAKAMAVEDAQARQAALEQALEAFRNIQPQEDGPMRLMAYYHQGRILQRLGRGDQAAEVYRKALEAQPDSVLEVDIELRLAQLGLPAQQPAAPDSGEGDTATP